MCAQIGAPATGRAKRYNIGVSVLTCSGGAIQYGLFLVDRVMIQIVLVEWKLSVNEIYNLE